MIKAFFRRRRKPRAKDPVLELRLYRRRAGVAGALVLIGLLGLAGRVAYLQTVAHQQLVMQADSNRIRLQPLPPTRGLIFDRNGVRLAQNLPTHWLEVVPELTGNLKHTLGALGRLIELSDEELAAFRLRRRGTPPHGGVPLKYRLSETDINRLAVELHRFPGVSIEAGLSRHYPLGPVAAHAVGYVGRIDEAALARIDASEYRGSTHTGKTGIERFYEDRLHGRAGHQQVETNARGRVLRVLQHKPPVAGENLTLSIDVRLQRTAMLALGDYSGSVVAIDPRNGEVLALVSQPSYDTNLFVHGIDVASYRALSTSPDRPLYNRAVLGIYPPGSTIKPLMELAGLENRLIRPHDRVYCPGYYRLPGRARKYRDWKRGGHGRTDGSDAIAQSCDVYFYDLALKMGIDTIHGYLGQFGLGSATGIDLLGEKPGLLPSQEWKRRRHDEPWYAGDTVVVGIGQGFMLTTPLQLAHATAILARNGQRFLPRLLRVGQTPTPRGNPSLQRSPQPLPPVPVQDPQNWHYVRNAMAEVVHGSRGTARRVGQGLTYRMAGKTGTAQVFSLADNQEYDADKLDRRLHDHALFIAFAPVEDPRIAVAVVVENGGSGSRTAAPVARQVLDAHLLGDDALDGPFQTAVQRPNATAVR